MEKKFLQNIGFAAIAVGLMATPVSADKYDVCAENIGKNTGENAGAIITRLLEKCKGNELKLKSCLTNVLGAKAKTVNVDEEVEDVVTKMTNCVGGK